MTTSALTHERHRAEAFFSFLSRRGKAGVGDPRSNFRLLSAVRLCDQSDSARAAGCWLVTPLRHRDSLVQVASAHLLRVPKALEQMNVLLHRAVTGLTGTTGLAILDAIIAGERDPRKLAAHRDYRCKKSEVELAAALKGDWKEDQLFALRQSLAAWRFHHQLADECLQEIHRLAAEIVSRTEAVPPPPTKRGKQPDEGVRTVLFQKFGVDVTAVDGVSTRPVSNRLATALRMSAQSLNRVESPLGDWFRRMRAKLGPAGAVTAAAHKLTRILYSMIKTGTAFDPGKLGNPALIRQRKERSLRKLAAQLGFSLQPANAGAVS